MSASWYNRNVLPCLLDFLCSLEPVRRQREKIVPRAEGRVLEVGIGTGLNVRHYDKTKVGKITGLDPALEMHRLASKRIAQADSMSTWSGFRLNTFPSTMRGLT